jgi:hypothetical protein
MIENARETGEREETAAEDAHRQARSEAMYIGQIVTRLMASDAMKFPANAEFLKRLDLALNVYNGTVARGDIDRVKDMAWKWRRQMPASPLTPKLPPDDPIVKEMGLA